MDECRDPAFITDGFGNYWEPDCPDCGGRMQVVRPGKARCENDCHLFASPALARLAAQAAQIEVAADRLVVMVADMAEEVRLAPYARREELAELSRRAREGKPRPLWRQ